MLIPDWENKKNLWCRKIATHIPCKLKFILPGPMTIVATIADEYYGARVELAMVFSALLHDEAPELGG